MPHTVTTMVADDGGGLGRRCVIRPGGESVRAYVGSLRGAALARGACLVGRGLRVNPEDEMRDVVCI